MSSYYSFQWDKVGHIHPNTIVLKIKCLNVDGRVTTFTRHYEEWMGVCTNRIDKMVRDIKHHFPKCGVRYERLGDLKKILPYFETRLRTGKLAYRDKSFYKVYLSAPVHEVGSFFNKHKIGYYDKNDWLVRVYIDMCTQYNHTSFLYRWYEVDKKSKHLLTSFRMLPDRIDMPDWTVASFDLETVPMDGGTRVPTGINPHDRIVTASVVKWSRGDVNRRVFFLTPGNCELPRIEDGVQCYSEIELLKKLHAELDGVHILTGYNILAFDLPCLFARLWWLKQYSILKRYTSYPMGTCTVTTYDDMVVIDMYQYCKTFSNYNLPSLKLDDVARVKLKGVTKLPVDSTGLHAWFTSPAVTPELVRSDDPFECYARIRPPSHIPEHRFGTIKTYVQYCLTDSDVVRLIFLEEGADSFLVERANFTAKHLMEALYFGNSYFLLEMFKTYGTRIGYFFNARHFVNATDMTKFKSMIVSKKDTYQGALNYCVQNQCYQDVAVMDFGSMYPSALVNGNLCYGTCTILAREEWSELTVPRDTCRVIPYRVHGDVDFLNKQQSTGLYDYPEFDPEKDEFAIIVNQKTQAFLPTVVRHFLDLRRHHQARWKATKNIYHYNVQLCIKILINSLYGVMASRDSNLAYVTIAMAITCLSRYQLLASYHYVQSLGYKVCYADTDSLMVEGWPHDDCDVINTYLNLQYVELKFEQRMKRLLVLSKKRYVYETADGKIVSKGFQKRINQLIRFMTQRILQSVFDNFANPRPDAYSYGWILWVETLLQANYMCRDPKEYSITRKTKRLDEYKSATCPAVRILKKCPEKENDFIDYVYSRADVQSCSLAEWIVPVKECQWVDFEHLFISQKKNFYALLNIGFWHLPNPHSLCQAVINAMRWKQFVHAELLHRFRTGSKILMLVERRCKYTFSINDHFTTKKRVVKDSTKRKQSDRLDASWIPPTPSQKKNK